MSSISLPALAGIPTADIVGAGQRIMNQLQEAQRFIQEKQQKLAEFQANGLNHMFGIENENNIAANQETRAGKRAEALQKVSAKKTTQPDLDSCGTMAATDSIANNSGVPEVSNEFENEKTRYFKDTLGETNAEQVEKTDRISKSIINTCAGLTYADNEDFNGLSEKEIELKALSISNCKRTENLFSHVTSLTVDEARAINVVIDLIGDPFPIETDTDLIKQDTAIGRKEKVKNIREVNFSQISSQALRNATRWKMPGKAGISALDGIKQFNDKRFGSKEWIGEVANTPIDQVVGSGKYVLEEALINRKMLITQAYMSRMAELQFNQMNDLIVVNSAILARLNDLARD